METNTSTRFLTHPEREDIDNLVHALRLHQIHRLRLLIMLKMILHTRYA